MTRRCRGRGRLAWDLAYLLELSVGRARHDVAQDLVKASFHVAAGALMICLKCNYNLQPILSLARMFANLNLIKNIMADQDFKIVGLPEPEDDSVTPPT